MPISGNVDIGELPGGNNHIGTVTVYNPGIVNINANTISVALCQVGGWYRVELIGSTSTLQWRTLGTEPVNFRIFRALVTGTPGSGTVSLLQYNENVVVKTSALPTGASTEATLSAINDKTPALGLQAVSASQPVCLPTDQLIALSSVKASANIYLASQLTIGNWYKVETIESGIAKAIWTATGALIGTVESSPIVGRIFRALNNGVGAGLSTFSSIIYSENVKVGNFPALQPVSLSNPEIAPIPNTISIRQCKIGFWYKIEQVGTTPNQAWIDLGTEPIVGRVFRVNLDNQYILELTGTGEVSILPYFTAAYTDSGTQYFQPNAVLVVDLHPMVNPPFISNTVSNTAQQVTPGYTKLRSVLLQKTDIIITYVYLYNKYEPPTDADTPVFRFIVKDTPIQLQFNQLFYEPMWIRATPDLNGTTDPIANTLFVNITYG